jgi:DNA-binding GntR family transcriptional regulator
VSSPPATGPAGRLDLPTLGTRLSLRERVSDALRAALVSGGMVPGVTYSVPTLAERFGVSATPVREAMLDLVKQGMVEAVPNKGFRVLEVSDDELDDVTQIRALLEVPTVASLSGRVTQEQTTRLRALAQEVTDAAAAGDLVGYVLADRRFHLDLLALAGNGRLVEIVAQLRARTRLYGLDHLTAEDFATSCTEHGEILDALAAGAPPAQVETIMAKHLGHVRGMWAGHPDPAGQPSASGPAGSR